MTARTPGPSYQEQTRPNLELRLVRLRDCRAHGESGLDDEITTLCQSLTVIDTLTADNARLREALAGIMERIDRAISNGDQPGVGVSELLSNARAALAGRE